MKHEVYQEIGAAAAVGQATPEELAKFRQHAAECLDCGDAYRGYLAVAAQQFVAGRQDLSLSPRTAQDCLSSDLLTRRFFQRAATVGITFSSDAEKDVARFSPRPPSFCRQGWSTGAIAAIAAGLIICIVGSAGYVYSMRAIRPSNLAKRSTPIVDSRATTHPIDIPIANQNNDNETQKLQAEIERLTVKLRNKDAALSTATAEATSATHGRQAVQSERDAMAVQLQQAQQQLANAQTLVANREGEAVGSRNRAQELEAALVATNVKLQETKEQLDETSGSLQRERQLLAMGRDVNELMGARNLHIVDVVDTDPHGKTKPVFGRIFFTQGKSLVFYAYDLSDGKAQKANYQYRVWAMKEGQDKRVTNLGVFYSDDKSQKRWVFKCADPKVLTEIDSVFVTLEAPDSDPSRPKGMNLMYAYLHGQPNHP